MEAGLKNYIKNMFAMNSTPVWDSSYEGVIFYDKNAKKWVVGNNAGWQVLDRKSTTISGVTPTKWIDPFEYPTNDIIRNNYETVGSGITVYSDSTNTTYGDYSLKGVTSISGSIGSYIKKVFTTAINTADNDYINFDIMSDREGETLRFSIDSEGPGIWSNVKKLVIPATNIDEDLTHFPVSIVINDENGLGDVFDELSYPARPESANDSFEGAFGDPPKIDLWETTNTSETGTCQIHDNKLRLTIPVTANDEHLILKSKFKIGSDFDIQIDYDIISIVKPSSSYSYPIQLDVLFDDGTSIFIRLQYAFDNTNMKFSAGYTGGSEVYLDDGDYLSSSKLRLVRTGSVIKAYYWSGTQWEWDGATDGYTITCTNIGNGNIVLKNSADFNGGSIIECDNFKINVGDVVWPILEDYFIGNNGELPNSDLWSYPLEIGSIQNNKFETDSQSSTDVIAECTSIFKIQGDFDVQVDFDILNYDFPNNSVHYVGLKVVFPTKYAQIAAVALDVGTTEWQRSGTDTPWATVNRTTSSGKFRFIRLGSVLKGYYWSGTQWEWGGSSSGFTFSETETGEVDVRLYYKQEGEGSTRWNVAFDNFKLNTGTVVWPEGKDPNRKKIAITKDDGISQLYCDIESWDAYNREATLWVSKDDLVLSSNEDTYLYLYYDKNQAKNITYIGDTGSSAAKNVWDDYYTFVLNMVQDPSGGTSYILDSTINSNIGTFYGTIEDADFTNGTVGKALAFDGTTAGIIIDRDITLQGALTCETSINLQSYGPLETGLGYGKIIDKNDSISIYFHDYSDSTYNDHSLVVNLIGHTQQFTPTNSVLLDTDHYIVVTYDAVNGLKIYIDGLLQSIDDTCTGGLAADTTAEKINIANRTGADRGFDGIMGTARLSSTARSASWVKAANLASKDDLVNYTYSNENTFQNELIYKNININKANTFQTEIVDITNVYSMGKTVKFTIIDDSLPNTFYIDNMSFGNNFINYSYINWIDSFEYNSDAIIRNIYKSSDTNNLNVSVEDTIHTQGLYGMKIAASISGSLNQCIVKNLTTPIDLTNEAQIEFDIKSSREGTNLQYNLGQAKYLEGFNNRIKISIDSTKIDSTLTHFPVPIVLGTSVGLPTIKSVDDNFTGEDGTLPDTKLWSTTGDVELASNTLKLGATTSSAKCASIFRLSGDFDISIDFDVTGNPSTDSWISGLYIFQVTDNNGYVVGRGYGGNSLIDFQKLVNGSWDSTLATVTTSVYTGKLRLTRSISTFTAYYDIGSGWVNMGSNNSGYSSEMFLRLTLGSWAGNPSVTAYFDNFKVNSGTIVWPEGTGKKSDLTCVFDELDYYNVDDDFTGVNDSLPDTKLWDTDITLYDKNNEGSESIYDGKLKLTPVSIDSDSIAAMMSKFKIEGDFDIEFELYLDGRTSSTDYLVSHIYVGRNTYCYVGFFTDHDYSVLANIESVTSFNNHGSAGSTVTESKFRVVRVGNLLTVYQQLPGESETAVVSNGIFVSDVVNITFYRRTEDSNLYSGYADNFKVNSGTIIWPENTHPNRKKIALTKGDGVSQLYGEIEHWDSINKKAVIWASKSDWLINNDQDTDVYLYYSNSTTDNTQYIGDTGDAASKLVWDPSFVGVWHLAQDPSGGDGCILDSTSNENHGTPYGAMTSNDLISGPIGKALDFDGDNDYINCGAINPDSGTALTVETIYKLNSDPYTNSSNTAIVGKYDNTNNEREYYFYYHNDNDNLNMSVQETPSSYDNTTTTSFSHVINTNDWFYAVLSFESQTAINLYIDSVLESSNTTSVPTDYHDTSEPFYISADNNGTFGDYAHLKNAEVRVSKVARSTSWIKANNYAFRDELLVYNVSEENNCSNELVCKNININTANQFQKEIVDISTVSGTCESIIFKVLNADLENTFYIDNMYLSNDNKQWLDDWVNRRKITIDNSNIDSDLVHFPVPIVLGTSVGQSNQNVSNIFDELASTDPLSDVFSGVDGDPPDSDLWVLTGDVPGVIASNKLSFTTIGDYGEAQSNFRVSGDFEIVCTLTGFQGSYNGENTYIYFVVDDNNRGHVSIRPHQLHSNVKVEGSWVSGVYPARTADTVIFKATRVGNVLTFYADQGSGFVQINTWTDAILNGDMQIRLQAWDDNATTQTYTFEDFAVNSGTVKWPSHHPNRKKIAITKSDGITQIYGEIEQWDAANEKAVIWVSKADLTLSASSANELYLYYDVNQPDNVTYIGDTGSTPAQTVWPSNYVGVWHMAQDPSQSGACVLDSTSNTNHGTPHGSMTSDNLINGLVGKGLIFDGVDDHIAIPYNATLNFVENKTFTIEAFFNAEDISTDRGIVGIWDGDRISDDTYQYYLKLESDNNSIKAAVFGDGTPAFTVLSSAASSVVTDNYKYTVFSGDGSNLVIQSDTISTAQTPYSNLHDVSSDAVPLRIGVGVFTVAPEYFKGKITSIRISNTALSAAWTKAYYHAQTDNLITWGDEEYKI